MSVGIVICFIRACPRASLTMFSHLLASTPFMSSFSVPCLLYGKENAWPTPQKLRGISPLPAALQIVDVMLARMVNDKVTDTCVQRPGVWIAGRPQTQVLDIAHGAHLMIEKALDDHSRGAAATSDIERFYGNVRLVLVARWLEHHGFPRGWCAALLRFQFFKDINVNIGNLTFNMQGRSCGTLTGSRTAGAAARLAVESSVLACSEGWDTKGYQVGTVSLTAATSIDNFFAISSSAQGAVAILDNLAAHLRKRWKLNIKPSSREFIAAKGGCNALSSEHHWKQVTSLECLGHLVSDDCCVRLDWERTARRILG